MKKMLFALLAFSFNSSSQTVSLLTSAVKVSFRGLSVVDDKIIWASGNKGTVGRSTDGGFTWKWLIVSGYEKNDFRDIEAFDSSTAVIMAVDEPAYILKTTDGGESWKLVYENKTKGMFLDAMDFSDNQNGIVVGDPVDNKFFMATTLNGGTTWLENSKNYQAADSGEACFASSGTNIRLSARGNIYFVSGGLHSRFFNNKKAFVLPVLQGTESTGANSFAFKNKKTFIIVGGDFKTPDAAFKNCAITYDEGKTWSQPAIAPHGYRSCIEYIDNNRWITCGLNGVDYSSDNGNTWQWISKESFNVCKKARNSNAIFFAGNGKIGKIDW